MGQQEPVVDSSTESASGSPSPQRAQRASVPEMLADAASADPSTTQPRSDRPNRLRGGAVDTRSPRRQLQRIRRAVPTPGPGEPLVPVQACGACRTDLHLTLGELPPRRSAVIPGHQVVGDVVAAPPSSQFGVGDRVGAGWLRQTCGACQWCRDGRENLCAHAQYTGGDADGGDAEYAVVPAAFAHAIPSSYDSVHAAPLMCAEIIGYRALRRANLRPGGTLGIWGFGSSAHITAQIAQHEGAKVMVIDSGERSCDLARRLKVAFAGEAMTMPPRQVDASIVFAPAGTGRPGGHRPWRHRRLGGNPHVGDPVPRLPSTSLRRTRPTDGHRQHPRRCRRVLDFGWSTPSGGSRCHAGDESRRRCTRRPRCGESQRLDGLDRPPVDEGIAALGETMPKSVRWGCDGLVPCAGP